MSPSSYGGAVHAVDPRVLCAPAHVVAWPMRRGPEDAEYAGSEI